jgi:hypothetical protein
MPVSQSPKREETKSKTLGMLLPAELYVAVDVVDAAGIKANHVVFRAKGTKQFYRLLPDGAEMQMRPLAGWLNKLIDTEIDKTSPVSQNSGVEAGPSDMGEAVPTGSI